MTNEKGNWSTRGLELMQLEQTADIRVIIDDCTFHCHKAVLIMASVFFEKLLLTDCKETSCGVIYLEDVTPNIFTIFRKYIYSRDEELLSGLSNTQLLSLLGCANMWQADPVGHICLKNIHRRIPSMEEGELVAVFSKADLYDIETLFDPIKMRLSKMQLDSNCPEIAKLSVNCITRFLNIIDYLPDFQRFKIIQVWIEGSGIRPPVHVFPFPTTNVDYKDKMEKNGESCKLLNRLLSSINYIGMNFEDFYNGPWSCNLFDDSWKLNILTLKMGKVGMMGFGTTNLGIFVEFLAKACLFNNNFLKKEISKGLTSIARTNKIIDLPQAIALNAKCFEIYIGCFVNIVRELDRFILTEKWIKANLTIDNETKQNLLDNINYNAMDIWDFDKGPGRSTLIDIEHKYKYLTSVVQKFKTHRFSPY